MDGWMDLQRTGDRVRDRVETVESRRNIANVKTEPCVETECALSIETVGLETDRRITYRPAAEWKRERNGRICTLEQSMHCADGDVASKGDGYCERASEQLAHS